MHRGVNPFIDYGQHDRSHQKGLIIEISVQDTEHSGHVKSIIYRSTVHIDKAMILVANIQ